MERLSIAIFTYSTKPRGSVVHSACLAEALCALGHDATLYALDKDGEGFFRPLRCPLVRVPAGPAPADMDALIAQRIDELRAHLVEHPPPHAVLHAEDCLVASALLAARERLPHARIVRTVHHVERFESPYLERCQRRSVCDADRVLAVSAATARDVSTHYARKAVVIENGVDVARYATCGSAAALALRARLDIPADAPLVVSVGGVETRKNTLGMLAAFALLHARMPRARYVIAGGASIFEHGAYRRAFELALAELPACTRAAVRQLGVLHDADMPALFASADVLLHASTHEGFGLCVLEAMAAGTEVVVSRGEPFDEFLDDGCARRVDAHDPEEIARALHTSLSARSPARVQAARARAEHFSWRRAAERHVDAYTESEES